LIIKTGVSAQPQLVILDTILDNLNKELFTQLINGLEHQANRNINSSSLLSIHKNQNEILRCFAELGKIKNKDKYDRGNF
jgi:ABC-type molybdenum transport system ATPase subunit/photorepair protein PhrA